MKQRYPLTQRRPRRKQPPFSRSPASETLHRRLNELLDEALDETFPASDAFYIGRRTEADISGPPRRKFPD
jgi:hypothetical protein